MAKIPDSMFEVPAYLHGFHYDEKNGRWFVRASLIVDKVKSEDAPFVFQSVSLLCVGTAKRILESYNSAAGAERAYMLDAPEGKRTAYILRIRGYSVVSQDNPEYPWTIQGRVVSIDDNC